MLQTEVCRTTTKTTQIVLSSPVYRAPSLAEMESRDRNTNNYFRYRLLFLGETALPIR